jgi:Tol biopolymer transport system component
MKRIVINIILLTALIAGSISTSFAQSAEQLYQKGLMKEEGEGSLREAIVFFNQVADNSSASISLRAKALLHVGMCFEKLGTQEAANAYQRLVNSFPSQKNEVAIARERLSRLILMTENVSEIPPKPNFIKVKMPANPGNGMLSPDGKQMAFILDGCVWTAPISGGVDPYIAGEPKKLTGNIGARDMSNSFCWSGDGKWIAFNAKQGSNNPETDIYVISSDGGNARKVQVPSHVCGWPEEHRVSLSPDGKMLAYATGYKPGDWQNNFTRIFTFPVNGGKAKVLTEPGTLEPAWSPDGSKIAYVKRSRDNDGNEYSELLVIPAEGGTPKIVIARQLEQIRGPVWSIDGKMIAYIKRPAMENPKEIWLVQLNNEGDPEGTPRKVDLPLESFHTIAGWTPNNKIGIQLMNPEYETIYTVPSTGGIATQVTPQGWTSYPKWSPDGKRIFFRSAGPMASVHSQGGAVDTIKIDSEFITGTAVPGSGNDISPDGKTIVFAGQKVFYEGDKKNWEVDIFTVPVEGGKPKQLTSISKELQDRFPCWSPDGNSIAFIRPEIIDRKFFMHIYIISREGENLRRITDKSDSVAWAPIDWTHDGKSITYFSKGNTIRSIPSDGGESKFITKIDSTNSQFDLAWSPDGKELAYTDKGKIWLFNHQSGITKEVRTGVSAHATKLGWSPDGKKIAFTAFAGGDAELWMMENFLPLEKLQQQPKSEIAKASGGINIKQVWSGIEADNTGSVSLDGKYLSFVDWETGDLAIRDLTKGLSRRLTKEGTYEAPNQFAYSSTISPDGKQVAYAWFNPDLTYEIRFLEIDNPVPRTLYSNKNESVFPAFWLSDGKKLIAKRYLFNSNETKTQIVSIVIPNGSVNVLKTIESECQMRLCSSSDNKYIAYEYPSDLNNENYDIHLLSMDGTYETYLTNHPANDRLLGWINGSNEVLFTSNRSGSWDLWSVQIENGKLSGLPVRILPEIGEISPLGFTKEGSLYYSIFSRMFTGLITSFNMGTGITGLEESKKSLPGSISRVEWSPDGEFVAYVKEEKRQDNYFPQLYILNLTTGAERSLCKNFTINNSIRWSPDSRTILAVGRDENKRGQQNYNGGIYTIDTKTGQLSEILLLPEIKDIVNPIRLAVAEWSSDGKSIYYLNRYQLGGQIVKRDLKTGEEKVIYNGENLIRILRLSPASNILLFAYENPESKKIHICTIPAEGGNTSEICTSQETVRLRTAVWSPDGKSIFFTETPTLNYSKLWRVSATGGTPQYVCQLPHLDVDLSIHPSGQKIALSYYEQTAEIRAIENLGREVAELQSRNE